MSLVNWRWIVRLYCAEYWLRMCRLKLAKQQNRTEGRPVHRLAAWRVQDSVEWIGVRESSALVLEWRVEQSVDREGAAAERRLGTELLQHQLLDRIVEEPPACADAGLARSSRTPSNPNTRSECFVVGLRQAVGYTRHLPARRAPLELFQC